jgi:hypothetical protein
MAVMRIREKSTLVWFVYPSHVSVLSRTVSYFSMISERMVGVSQNSLMECQSKLKRMGGEGQVRCFYILSTTMNTSSAEQEDVSQRNPLISKSRDHSNELMVGCSPEKRKRRGYVRRHSDCLRTLGG